MVEGKKAFRSSSRPNRPNPLSIGQTVKMSNHTLANTFRSSRLIYRAVDEASPIDQGFLFSAIDNDPTGVGNLSFCPVAPGNHAAMVLIAMTKGSLLRVLACLPPDESAGPEAQPTPIGFAALMPRAPDAAHHRHALLGVVLAAPFRGQGYGKEVVNWVLDWGFVRGGLHRIGLGVFGYNGKALKMYRSLGFTEEGRDREAVMFERQWWDVVNFGMLESEWEKLRG